MLKLPFEIVPVIDLLNGRVVHAVSGRRAYYQPVHSVLHASSEPIPMARAICGALGLQSLYLADLDAIAGSPPHFDTYRELIASRLHLWVDAGVRDRTTVVPLLELDSAFTTIVAGLETIGGRRELANIVQIAGPERIVFSLDLFDGRPRTAAGATWESEDPVVLALTAIDCGVQNLLILDLARVGTGRGLGSDDLIGRIRAARPSVHLYVGGGISRLEEVCTIREAGAAGVLIGSALHDGRIGARELERINAPGH